MKCNYCQGKGDKITMLNKNTQSMGGVCRSCLLSDRNYCEVCSDSKLMKDLTYNLKKQFCCGACYEKTCEKCCSCSTVALYICICGYFWCNSCAEGHFLKNFTDPNHFYSRFEREPFSLSIGLGFQSQNYIETYRLSLYSRMSQENRQQFEQELYSLESAPSSLQDFYKTSIEKLKILNKWLQQVFDIRGNAPIDIENARISILSGNIKSGLNLIKDLNLCSFEVTQSESFTWNALKEETYLELLITYGSPKVLKPIPCFEMFSRSLSMLEERLDPLLLLMIKQKLRFVFRGKFNKKKLMKKCLNAVPTQTILNALLMVSDTMLRHICGLSSQDQRLPKASKYLQKFEEIIEYVLKYYQNVPELIYILQKKQKLLIIIDKFAEASDICQLNLKLISARYPLPTEALLKSIKLHSKVLFIQTSPEFIPCIFHLIYGSQCLQNNSNLIKAIEQYTNYLTKTNQITTPSKDFLHKVLSYLSPPNPNPNP